VERSDPFSFRLKKPFVGCHWNLLGPRYERNARVTPSLIDKGRKREGCLCSMDYEGAPDWEDFYEPEIEEHDERPRDPMVDAAKAELKTYFAKNNEWVFYKRQLEVLFEGTYFHWITDRALTELAAEGYIATETEEVPIVGHLTFVRAKGHRYWRRQADEIKNVVVQFSNPAFTAALGAQGEQMFDAALPRFGFMPAGTKVKSYGGRTWAETGHDLDRVFVRDGIAYGAEIKNTLKYIPSGEFQTKLKMCRFLGLRPLFITRFAPKSYNHEVILAGGFSLIFNISCILSGRRRLRSV
jgi:hypothetical protein